MQVNEAIGVRRIPCTLGQSTDAAFWDGYLLRRGHNLNLHAFAMKIVEAQFGAAGTDVVHATSDAHNVRVSSPVWDEFVP